MKLVRSYGQMERGFDEARAALSSSPDDIVFIDSDEARSFAAALPLQPERRLLFSYPSGLLDENRLSHIGIDYDGRLHFLRQSPVEKLAGKGFGFAKAGSFSFTHTKRVSSITDPVWLDFGVIEAPNFAPVFAGWLAAYFHTWDTIKKSTAA